MKVGRVVSSMRVFAVLALALLVALPAAIAQPFYYAPSKALALDPPANLNEPVSGGVTVCEVACVRNTVEYAHEVVLTAAGHGRPVHSHLWVQTQEPTAGASGNTPAGSACSLELFAQVLDASGANKWYWDFCVGLEELGALSAPGLHEISIDWPSNYNDVDVVPGDTLFAEVWTSSTSTTVAPTLFLVGDATHPSGFEFSGLNESGPAAAQANATAPPPPAPTSTSSSVPSMTTSTSHAPPTSRAPPTTAPPTSETTADVPVAPTSDTPSPAPTAAKGSPAVAPVLVVAALAGALSMRRRLP